MTKSNNSFKNSKRACYTFFLNILFRAYRKGIDAGDFQRINGVVWSLMFTGAFACVYKAQCNLITRLTYSAMHDLPSLRKCFFFNIHFDVMKLSRFPNPPKTKRVCLFIVMKVIISRKYHLNSFVQYTLYVCMSKCLCLLVLATVALKFRCNVQNMGI